MGRSRNRLEFLKPMNPIRALRTYFHRLGRKVEHSISRAKRFIRIEFRGAQREFRSADLNANEEATFFEPTIHIPVMLSGFLLIIIFAPIAYLSAKNHGADPVDVLLVQAAPPGLDSAFFNHWFPEFSAPAARPLIYALASLYGAAAVVSGLVLASGIIARLPITANGIVWGFMLTRFLSVNVFGFMSLDAFSRRMFHIKLWYVVLIYYACEALIAMFRKDDFSGEKYDFLFNGLAALASGWVLARGFGANAAIFAGVLYLFSTFVCMLIAEKIFGVLYGFLQKLMGPRNWSYFRDQPPMSLRQLLGHLRQAIQHPKLQFVSVALVSLCFPTNDV